MHRSSGGSEKNRIWAIGGGDAVMVNLNCLEQLMVLARAWARSGLSNSWLGTAVQGTAADCD